MQSELTEESDRDRCDFDAIDWVEAGPDCFEVVLVTRLGENNSGSDGEHKKTRITEGPHVPPVGAGK